MRMIRQLAEVIARIVALHRSGREEEASAALEEAYRSFVGMPRAMIERLDVQTLATTVGPEKAMIIAALLDAEAKLLPDGATERAARARALRVAAGLPPNG